jgi:hypothetical protein
MHLYYKETGAKANIYGFIFVDGEPHSGYYESIKRYTKMKSNMKIPLHLFINKKSLDRAAILQAARYAAQNAVSSVWIDVAEDRDLDLIGELSSSLHLQVVGVQNRSSLIPGVLTSSSKGIALSNGSIVKELLHHRDMIINRGFSVYLCIDNEKPVISDKHFLSHINETLGVAEKLKRGGIENIFLHLQHPNPVLLYNLCKEMKKLKGLKHIFSFTYGPDPECHMINNSLSLGPLFYEGAGEAMLIRFASDMNYSPENIKDAAEKAKLILGSLGLFPKSFRIISCPTCGRCRIDLATIAHQVGRKLKELEERLRKDHKNPEDIGGITVAVMGCNVNGPREAAAADIGIAGRKNNTGILFKNGKVVTTVPEEKLVQELVLHTEELINQRFKSGI